MEDSLPWEEPHTGAGEKTENEGATEILCDELTAIPILHPSVWLAGKSREMEGEVGPGKNGGVRGRCFKIWFYFSLSYSDFDWQ